jgi:hypothetical protein
MAYPSFIHFRDANNERKPLAAWLVDLINLLKDKADLAGDGLSCSANTRTPPHKMRRLYEKHAGSYRKIQGHTKETPYHSVESAWRGANPHQLHAQENDHANANENRHPCLSRNSKGNIWICNEESDGPITRVCCCCGCWLGVWSILKKCESFESLSREGLGLVNSRGCDVREEAWRIEAWVLELTELVCVSSGIRLWQVGWTERMERHSGRLERFVRNFFSCDLVRSMDSVMHCFHIIKIDFHTVVMMNMTQSVFEVTE